MQGKPHLFMDNLIAEGKARPFIIVMDNGTWSMPGRERPRRVEDAHWPPEGWADTDPSYRPTGRQSVISRESR